jgi:phage terminase large subunit
VIHEFRVRWYQQDFHRALVDRTHDRLMAVWHRRAGKDEVTLDAERTLALKDPGTYWHCFPEQKQARKAIWNGVDGRTGKRRIFQAFPERIIARMQDDDMFIEFKKEFCKGRTSTWQMIGSDRYDSTVGSGPKGITYSEWALSNPSAWAYHSPMIRESGGYAAFITTPRGNNHAKTMADRALRNPQTWFYQLLSIEDTKSLAPEVLKEALEEYQDLYGIDLGQALFDQEYYCSWSGAMVGAYWGAEMFRAERKGRILPLEVDWSHPVHCAMDLGKAVNNPLWFFQVIGGTPYIVDFYRPDSEDLDDWLKWREDRGYHTGAIYVPHDIMVTEWGSSRTRLEILEQKVGIARVRRVPKVSLADGLQAGRKTINEAIFHRGDTFALEASERERAERMELGLSGLQSYRREYDDELKRFRDNPLKDWAEHIGSAFRYLSMAWREPWKAPEAETKAKPAPGQVWIGPPATSGEKRSRI